MISLNSFLEEEFLTSVRLLDEEDSFEDPEAWMSRLGIPGSEVKVLSVVGKTGEGKSHLLNEGLFDGKPVFRTCGKEVSEDSGVWSAYHGGLRSLVLDTEGLSGQGSNENKRLRRLLKVLALSDLVVYKTNSERLHNDLFYFLSDASLAYEKHFLPVLKSLSLPLSGGPSVLILHETQYTDVLPLSSSSSIIAQRFQSMNLHASAFDKIKYLGFKAGELPSETKLTSFRNFVHEELKDTAARPFRNIRLVYDILQALNAKFNGEISPSNHRSFPEEYFTCSSKCLSCFGKCVKPKSHTGSHSTDSECRYQKLYDNKRYLCLRCYQNGSRVVVVPKASSSQEGTFLALANYAWSGFVLECLNCGVIYRSRQHWYGNQSPESLTVVKTEVSHIWPGERTLQGTHNAGRLLLDGVSNLSGTVTALSSVAPTKTMTNWVTDQIAPDYWRPNAEITNCSTCGSRLNVDIHHCRACGEGFCEECSDYKRPCPERGWGSEPVRVCQNCYNTNQSSLVKSKCANNGIHARKVGERVVESLSALTSVVFDYPMTILKESARPNYWVPDDECVKCSSCDKTFDNEDCKESSGIRIGGVHHCRQCGQGVCDSCSKTRRPVPQKGWDHPVRICDNCL